AAAGLESARRFVTSANRTAILQTARAQRSAVLSQQAAVAANLSGLGGTELARVQVAHNAIAVRIDAQQLDQVAALPGVLAVRPVIHYQLTLGETVPYVGATAVQASGFDGTGVKVAVLDSGVDYTHRNLGGPGTTAAYAAAYGADPSDPKNTTRDGLFPTAKVVDGFDFVGEQWPLCPDTNPDCRSEDPDPIDFDGHGTHVADIIAGLSADGAHKGMAPGAKLVGVKVCSSVTTSCNGIALLKAMDFALDPDGDGDLSDAVDVINMSLGSDYGQTEDDLTFAATNAVALGVAVVTSAGNGSNKPYVVGSPSIGRGVISVAQTQVPSAKAFPLVINAPAAIAGVYPNTATVDWAPIGAGVTGDVVAVGRGCPADSIAPGSPEDPYQFQNNPVNPAGKIALIDRGACAVSLKVDRAAKAGATGVLIGLVAAGDPISFSFGGGTQFVPTLVITQALSTAIKQQLAGGQTVNASISPATSIPLIGSMVGSSSRGPSIGRQEIKPEIGAPGASVSAEVGTGDGETAFGGTSGASPMVAGAVAQMLQAHPNRSPEQIKAMLMNSAETTIYTNPAVAPGDLAPISRIGAGELRVDRAVALTAIAWNRETKSAALSFGAVEAAAPLVLRQKLRVENFADTPRTFTITPSFRYANDEASGAVKLLVHGSVHLGARSRQEIDVVLLIDPSKLPSWTLNGGSRGGNGALLNLPEYDGYITLTSGSEKLSVPWHVLPRKASATVAGPVVRLRHSDGVNLFNFGAEAGDFDVFSLTGTSPRLPRNVLPDPGDAFAIVDLQSVGVRFLPSESFGADFLEFAITTHGRRAHPNYPAEFDIGIDTNGDGEDDFVVFNAELGGFSATGQNVVVIANLTVDPVTVTPVFFTDADLNSGNVIFTVPMNSSAGPVNLGVARGTTITFSVFAFDNYFTGNLTDQITGMRFTPGNARFEAVGDPFGSVPAGGRATQPVRATTVPQEQSTESALLLLFRRNAIIESEIVRVR
ncbi:MAG TPA: S8 family serine peptidase, partial [Burkholderiaceae bacterium]|nr:S8 family serine peptidase [Burkholderiaceae bacterium]